MEKDNSKKGPADTEGLALSETEPETESWTWARNRLCYLPNSLKQPRYQMR